MTLGAEPLVRHASANPEPFEEGGAENLRSRQRKLGEPRSCFRPLGTVTGRSYVYPHLRHAWFWRALTQQTHTKNR